MNKRVVRRITAWALVLAFTAPLWCVRSAASSGLVFAVETDVSQAHPGEYITVTLFLLGGEDASAVFTGLQAYICFDHTLFALDTDSVTVLYKGGGLRVSPLRFNAPEDNRLFVNHTGLGSADLRGRSALVTFRLLALRPGTGRITLDAAELYAGGAALPGVCREVMMEVVSEPAPSHSPTIPTPSPTASPAPAEIPPAPGGSAPADPSPAESGEDADHFTRIRLPFTPDEHLDPDGYALICQDEAGGLHILDSALVCDGGFYMEGLAACAGPYQVIWCNPVPYGDVAQTDWYYEAVKAVHRMGLMQGTGEGCFAPNATLSRSMFVQILANLEVIELTPIDRAPFQDVAQDQWYAPAVAWAAQSGLVGGVGGGFFAPGAAVTREQMAVMLYRYCLYKGLSAPDAAPDYMDAEAVSPWAAEAVAVVTALGWMNGKPGGRFDPSGTATRAEAAALFARFASTQESGTSGEFSP